ncbi:hypothetical protein ZEAMMB73_Zm00001d024193 [Zea mays]|uniref:Uncharacterized protein n=1 Tax=Zea mays TaxID=4577 RepID=A0A1D6IXW9_MAIZE|nr:hypothetical protein ZEAMMB73_Zm00001d024193 [Zea mays]
MDYAFLDFISCQILTLLLSPARLLLILQVKTSMVLCLSTFQDDKLTYVTNFMDHLISWHTVTLRMMRAKSFVNLGEPNILEA